ncbi:MAG: hypothetical protein HS111_24490 [Kofleriaceae bacterium]|nr:hypothetical protein [Kofleriaceae bacterium]
MVAGDRPREALVEGGVAGVAERRPRRLGLLDRDQRVPPLEDLGQGLDLAHELGLLGAAAADLVGLARPLRLLGREQVVELLAGALADRLGLGLLRHLLEHLAPAQALDREQAELLGRRVDGDGAQHLEILDARDRGLPHLGRAGGARELGQRARVLQLVGSLLADGPDRRPVRDLGQRPLIAQREQPLQRRLGELLVVVLARARHPHAGGARAGQPAQGVVGVAARDLGQHLGLVELLDRDPTHAGVLVGARHRGEDVRLVGGQGAHGLEAHAHVAVAVLGTEEIDEAHGCLQPGGAAAPRKSANL